MTQAQSPLDQTLAAAAQAANGDATQTAQPISQVETGSVVNQDQSGAPAVSNQQVAQYQAPAPSLTMDSGLVQSQSSITDFFKLTDGGCSIADVKYDPIKVRLRVEDASQGGGFKPALMMNYEAPSGMVYTKSYDNQTTSSNNPAHAGLPWAANKQKILGLSPKAYEFLGYDIAFVVAEDVQSKDKKSVLKAGTVLGFTTPYTAAKLLKKVWDGAMGANARGKDAILTISGEEVSKNGIQFKKLVVVEHGYEDAKNIHVEPEDAE